MPRTWHEAHENLLRAAGLLRDSERLEHRRPYPATNTGYVEGVMVDDRLGVRVLDREEAVEQHTTGIFEGRDVEAFNAPRSSMAP